MNSGSFPNAMSFGSLSVHFVCKVCNKQFAKFSALNSHKFQHTAEKPFCCDHCGREFVCERQCHVHVISHILGDICVSSISKDPGTEALNDFDKTLFDNNCNEVVKIIEDKDHMGYPKERLEGPTGKVINDKITHIESSDFNPTIRSDDCNQAKEMPAELSTEVVIFNKKRILVTGGKHENGVPNQTKLVLTVLPEPYKHNYDIVRFTAIEHAYAAFVEDSARADQIRNSGLQSGSEVNFQRASGAAQADKESSNIPKSDRVVRSENSVKSLAPLSSTTLTRVVDDNGVNDQEADDSGGRPCGFNSSLTHAVCQVCGKRFANKHYLQLHMQVHGTKFQCEFCDEMFTNIINHKRHVKTVHPTEIEEPEKNYQCGVCNMQFVESGSLKSHMNIHTGEGPQCGICDKRFLRFNALIKHMNNHTGERPYKCFVCNKSFKEAGPLMYHKRIHTGERPYKCEQCDKDFIKSSHLERHIRTHSKSKPVSCRFCRRRFTNRGGQFSKHESTCRSAKYKKFVCGICGITFAVKGSLNSHMRIHGEKRFACSICGKGFIWRYLLRNHMSIHMAKKQYKCGTCDKEFRTSSVLRTHVSDLHCDAGDFVCDVCDKQFRYVSALNDHMHIHSGAQTGTRTHW